MATVLTSDCSFDARIALAGQSQGSSNDQSELVGIEAVGADQTKANEVEF